MHGGKSFVLCRYKTIVLCRYKTIVLRRCTIKASCQRKTFALTPSR